jgi:hypothetical protein
LSKFRRFLNSPKKNLANPFKFAIFLPQMPHFYKKERFTEPCKEARSDGIYGGKEIPRQAFPTPATPFPFGKGE